MNVHFLGSTWKYHNNLASIDELFAKIEESLEEGQLYISHLVIDDEEIFEDYKVFFATHIEQIQEVKIVVTTLVDMVNEILRSTESYLDRALPEMQILIDQFYQGPSSETWEKFAQMLEGLQWILQMVQSVDQLNKDTVEWAKYNTIAENIQALLIGMEEAVGNFDAVLLADLLHYELMSLLNALRQHLQHTIKHKVVNKYVN